MNNLYLLAIIAISVYLAQYVGNQIIYGQEWNTTQQQLNKTELDFTKNKQFQERINKLLNMNETELEKENEKILDRVRNGSVTGDLKEGTLRIQEAQFIGCVQLKTKDTIQLITGNLCDDQTFDKAVSFYKEFYYPIESTYYNVAGTRMQQLDAR
jgi:hypothetical protein